MRFSSSASITAMLWMLPLVASAQGSLPAGPGKEALQKICTSCHEVETVTGSRHTRIGWRQSVDEMISRGAEGSPEEMDSVVAYLTKFFGKVNVNTASVQDLEQLLSFSEKDAKAVAAYREQMGKFKDFEQLKNVPGIDVENLQAKRSMIAFSL